MFVVRCPTKSFKMEQWLFHLPKLFGFVEYSACREIIDPIIDFGKLSYCISSTLIQNCRVSLSSQQIMHGSSNTFGTKFLLIYL